MDRLPIDEILPDVVAALRQQASLVLRAPTGAGKTTRVPPALLDAGLAGTGQIVMLEPRRLAVRAAARRMTAERSGKLGDEIGYQVRFDRVAGPRTKLLVVTPGILLRLLHDDPYLEKVSVVVFDEFHERSLECNLALCIVRLVQQTVRPELRIVVMSATIATDAVAEYLGSPVVNSEGKLFPIDLRYEPKPADQPWPAAAAGAVTRLLDQTDGDVLVFLPGLGEIRQTARQLEAVAAQRSLAVLPLHGDLPAEQQDAALQPQGRRKVVLATNVAETSVTVDGIAAVVDTGLARQLVFDPAVGLDRLEMTPISRAAADQRAGRAGRTRPGVCVRLWSEVSHRGRPADTEPEIRRVDLAGAVLQLLCLGEKDVLQFPWLEPPREHAVAQALQLLRRLGALKDDDVTDLGQTLARLPVHPRIARLLIEGKRWGHADRVALAGAILSERDPIRRRLDEPFRGQQHRSLSDVLDRVESLEEFEGPKQHQPGGPDRLDRNAARFILRARDQLVRLLQHERGEPISTAAVSPDEAVLRSLLAAFPDRLARRREPGGRRGVMIGGRGVKLAPASAVSEPELFLCIDVDAGAAEALVRQASAVERAWLPADKLAIATEAVFDEVADKVVARRRVCCEDLVIEETPAALPDSKEVARILAEAARKHLGRVLPEEDSAAGLFLLRFRCLRQWMPELKLPAFDETELSEVMTWLCSGRKSFAELRKGPWLDFLLGKLTPAQRQTVEREAPERITVPTGSRIALGYQLGKSPVLPVRIQELFSLPETPRIAGGRVKVLLHLLAPNYRPQQVTDDLASFWANTYPQVRKELHRRYPKHAWPEDPLAATAVRGPRKRGE